MSKWCCQVSWDETPHLGKKQQKELLDSIPPYQREARSKGVPYIGEGAIYPVPLDDLLVRPFEIPDHFERCFGMDVGWKVTAGLWAARDPETDILYLYAEYYRGMAEPAVHVHGFTTKGRWIPGVIDPAAHGRQQKDGTKLIDTYRDLGMENLTPASNEREAGLFALLTRMTTGRLKVFTTLSAWQKEFPLYRRDEKGEIVKENDHLMDCMRYINNSGLAVAVHKPIHMVALGRNVQHKVDYDPMAEQFKLQLG